MTQANIIRALTLSLAIGRVFCDYSIIYTSTGDARVKCIPHTEMSKSTCRSIPLGNEGCPAAFGQGCEAGDMNGCPAGQIFQYEPSDLQMHGGDHLVDVGTCGKDCKVQRWEYDYHCCQCPTGYQAFSVEANCKIGVPACVGCTRPEETLVVNAQGVHHCKSNCKILPEHIAWLKKLEGYNSTFYMDTSHPPQKTIGYGHNCDAHKDCNKIQSPISKEDAQNLFIKDLAEAQSHTRKLPHVSLLNVNQYAALVSWAFNWGNDGAFYDVMLDGDFNAIPDIIAGNSGGSDLDSRRKAEIAMWNTVSNTLTGCPDPK